MLENSKQSCIEQHREEFEQNLNLAEDEVLEYCTTRHWIHLVPQLILPTLIVLGGVFVPIYRSAGGQFLVMNPNAVNQFGITNQILTGIGVVFAVLAFIVTSTDPKKKRLYRLIFAIFVTLMLSTVALRYQGWRIFSIDPLQNQVSLFDTYNLISFGVALFGLLLGYYYYFEWSDDYLILTNYRVVQWNKVLLGAHTRRQISIEDIQNVEASTGAYNQHWASAYPQHWLNYGTVNVSSASFSAAKGIEFTHATAPLEMQKRVMGKIKSRRSNESTFEFQKNIDEKVYGIKPDEPPPKPSTLKTSDQPGSLSRWLSAKYESPDRNPSILDGIRALLRRWVVGENPEIDESSGKVIWRTHWVFIFVVLIRPLSLLVIGFAAIFTAEHFYSSIIETSYIVIASLFLAIIFLLWAAWRIEDERNELYILTTDSIIDVEKRPFGPENRKTAGLGNIQNVTSHTSFIGRIVGYGDVVIETAGKGAVFTFHRLPQPESVVKTVNEYIARFKKGEELRNFNETLRLLKHYHDAQMRHGELVQPSQQESSDSASPEPSV
jgi:membrane protein YdbS with pleckstrin-like domain